MKRKKLIDERGRVFGLISVIDVAVIAVVLLLAAGIYVRYFRVQTTATAQPMTPITYTIKVENLRQYFGGEAMPNEICYRCAKDGNCKKEHKERCF